MPAATTTYLTALYGDRRPGQALARGRAEGGYVGAMNRAAELLAAGFPEATASPCDIAALYVEGGDKQHALDWLEKACEIRDPNVPYIGLPTYFGPPGRRAEVSGPASPHGPAAGLIGDLSRSTRGVGARAEGTGPPEWRFRH